MRHTLLALICFGLLAACEQKPASTNDPTQTAPTTPPSNTTAPAKTGTGDATMTASNDTSSAPAEKRIELLGFTPWMLEPDARALAAKTLGADVNAPELTAKTTFEGVEAHIRWSFHGSQKTLSEMRMTFPDYNGPKDITQSPFYPALQKLADTPPKNPGYWEVGQDLLSLQRDERWPKGASQPDVEWSITLYTSRRHPDTTTPEEKARQDAERDQKLKEQQEALKKEGQNP